MGYYSNYISHHGIEGQKWGVKNGPPYPLEKKGNKKKKNKNKNYNQSQNDQNADSVEEGKMKAMRTGNIELIQKYAEDMTAAELNEALRKMDLMEQLKNSDPSKNSVSKFDSAINKVDKINKATDTGIKAYNTVAAISNAIFGTDLEKVDTRPNNNNKTKRNNDRSYNQKNDDLNYYDYDDYIDGDYREIYSEPKKSKKKRK